MNDRDKEIAIQFKSEMSKIVTILDYKIFGSRVRGNQDEYSDMDVFIEVEFLDKELKSKIRDIAWEVGFSNSVYISPLVFTKKEIEDSPLRASPILESITKEGVSL